jgi:hypothetical protein
MSKIAHTMILCILGFASFRAPNSANPDGFFPFRAGTYWVYQGTLRWYDYENDKAAGGNVHWKMTVERVIRRKGVVAAIVTGFPADLDWAAGASEPKPWLILENENHQIFYENLGPDYDLSKLEGDDHVFDRFMVEDNYFLQWPLHQGAKFCGEEAEKRDDGMYCWVVAAATTKKLEPVKGMPGGDQSVFQLQYRTLPDDTTVEVIPGIGLLSYQYHHHGTVADTELQLVEFHPAPESSRVQGTKP